MQRREVEVSPGPEGTLAEARLDRYLARVFPDLSRSYIQKLIAGGNVLIDGQQAQASMRPSPGSHISVVIPEPEPTDLAPREMPLDVVYEDEDVLVVDKPAGLVVHPAPGHPSDTLANALLARYPDLHTGDALRPGIVHRLDKDTSGLMVIARNELALRNLQAQMQRHEVLKEYLALVRGAPKRTQGIIDAPIGRHPVHRQKMAVVEGGREARTHYKVIEQFSGYSLILARLETGRTHQIRVHFAALGHPIAGDPVYGTPGELGLTRQFLHAHRLAFNRPRDGEWVSFESPLPLDLERVLAELRARAS